MFKNHNLPLRIVYSARVSDFQLTWIHAGYHLSIVSCKKYFLQNLIRQNLMKHRVKDYSISKKKKHVL